MQIHIRNITGNKIKNLRKLNKMTQDELSAKLNLLGINIDRPMISKIENQSRVISDIELKAFSQVFNIDISDLFKD